MIRPTAALALALAAQPAAGQVISAAPERAALTIYRTPVPTEPDADHRVDEVDRADGMAFIREMRTVDLPAGRSQIRFRGVADTMIPETVALDGLPGPMIERNEDYNLLTPAALLRSALGKRVRVVRTNPVTGQVTSTAGVLRSVEGAPVVEADGRAEALGCAGQPERLVLDEAPPELSERPTFSMVADVPAAGRYQLRLSYLATGFDWAADYVAKIAPDGRTLDLLAWITLANQSAASFGDAPTEVVAGEISRDAETRPLDAPEDPLQTLCWGSQPRPRFTGIQDAPLAMRGFGGGGGGDGLEEIVVTAQRVRQTDLGDYKLYSLAEPTTVAARQTKQVRFLDLKRVPFQRLYTYRLDTDDFDTEDGPGPEAAAIVLRLKNEARAGLGKPLPAGVVTVLEQDPAGRPVLAGERRVRDTPVGLPLDVEIGQAIDVTVTPRVVEDLSSGERQRERVEVIVANGKPTPIVLEYRQARQGEDFKVSRASRRPGVKNGESLWTLKLGPGERTTLTYEISYTY